MNIRQRTIIILLSAIFFGVGLTRDIFAQSGNNVSIKTGTAAFGELKKRYQNDIDEFKAAQFEHATALSSYKKAKNPSNRMAAESSAKKVLKEANEGFVTRAELIKAVVLNSKALSYEDSQEIVSDMDKDIEWLKQESLNIDKVNTAKQILSQGRELRKFLTDQRIKIKKISGQVWIARLEKIIFQGESISAKIDDKIVEMDNSGKDTAALKNYKSVFDSKISSAKESLAEAKQMLRSSTILTDNAKIFFEIRQLMTEAKADMQGARLQLTKIINAVKKSE